MMTAIGHGTNKQGEYMNELDIQQSAMRELALFAGAGGGMLGGKLLGWRTICAVERDAYAAQVLAQRQNDGTVSYTHLTLPTICSV